MALFDIFKKENPAVPEAQPVKKTEKKAVKKEVKKAVKKEPKKIVSKEIKKEEKKESADVPSKAKKASEVACLTLKSPRVTEKSTDLTKNNQYVFNVYNGVNKSEIRKSVQDVYGVKVVAVKIINIHPKRRRLGRIEGWRKAYKKAIVRLAKGQTIEVLPR